jgi:hypothetical protein
MNGEELIGSVLYDELSKVMGHNDITYNLGLLDGKFIKNFSLGAAFLWVDSPQGHAFWQTVYDRIWL